MRESVIYQDIQQEAAISMLTRLLRRKVGTVPPALLVQIQSLPLNQMEDLGEALLDFNGLADLEAWLAQNQG
ncbi:hypothetical protein NIES4101_38700 [Calothrix sp. NIES-4101]|nr:hypothetical protein NIES4101_38700 [Calothrix sp. NIES-4101]